MTASTHLDEPLVLGNHELRSRLIAGTGKYPTPEIMREALRESGTGMVTVAIRRVDLEDRGRDSILGILLEGGYAILPNTAGCYNAKDAILTAQLAREALDTPIVKLEVIGDPKTLFPDNEELITAARTLVKEGFTVLPYTNDDPIICRKLEDAGCAAVMPLNPAYGEDEYGANLRGAGVRAVIVLAGSDLPIRSTATRLAGASQASRSRKSPWAVARARSTASGPRLRSVTPRRASAVLATGRRPRQTMTAAAATESRRIMVPEINRSRTISSISWRRWTVVEATMTFARPEAVDRRSQTAR